MVVAKALLFTFLLETVTASPEVTDSLKLTDTEQETEHSYVHDAKEGLSHMLDELKAFGERIEHSVLHTEKGAFVVAGILCSIAMVVLIGGALYFHCFGNYVTKYVRVVRKNGKEVTEDHHPTSEINGRLKSE